MPTFTLDPEYIGGDYPEGWLVLRLRGAYTL